MWRLVERIAAAEAVCLAASTYHSCFQRCEILNEEHCRLDNELATKQVSIVATHEDPG